MADKIDLIYDIVKETKVEVKELRKDYYAKIESIQKQINQSKGFLFGVTFVVSSAIGILFKIF